MMVVYIKKHDAHAGKWIYKGYELAWKKQGYRVEYYNVLEDLSSCRSDYYIMAVDSDVRGPVALESIARAVKAFVFVQPNSFPVPWGTHPNFKCLCPDVYIQALNSLENTHLWTFADVNPFYNRWENVKTLPLAFDSVSYKEDLDKKYEFDICYIGGWANNGFGEKRKIMINFFSKISKMDIKCGVFIDKNLTHEQENKILSNTRIPINIHDAYQQELGYDTNERTFKSLGLNGFLISDKVSQLERIFPLVPTAEGPEQMCEMIEQYLQKDLTSIKLQNRSLVRQHHSYIQRVSEMVAW